MYTKQCSVIHSLTFCSILKTTCLMSKLRMTCLKISVYKSWWSPYKDKYFTLKSLMSDWTLNSTCTHCQHLLQECQCWQRPAGRVPSLSINLPAQASMCSFLILSHVHSIWTYSAYHLVLESHESKNKIYHTSFFFMKVNTNDMQIFFQLS